MSFRMSYVKLTFSTVPPERTRTTLAFIIVSLELLSSLAGRTLSSDPKVMTVRDCASPSDSVMFISTDELKSALKVSVKVVLFKMMNSVSMLKDSLVRPLVKVSRENNNLPLTLVGVCMFLWASKTFRVSFELSVFHDCFESFVKTPVVIRTSYQRKKQKKYIIVFFCECKCILVHT